MNYRIIMVTNPAANILYSAFFVPGGVLKCFVHSNSLYLQNNL